MVDLRFARLECARSDYAVKQGKRKPGRIQRQKLCGKAWVNRMGIIVFGHKKKPFRADLTSVRKAWLGLSPGCRNRARKEQQPFPNRKKSQSFTVIDLPFDAYCDTKGFIIGSWYENWIKIALLCFIWYPYIYSNYTIYSKLYNPEL